MFDSIFPVFGLIAGMMLLFMLVFLFRWRLWDWLDDVLLGRSKSANFVAHWVAHHGRLLRALDKAIVGPFVILSFALSLIFHHWFFVGLWGLNTWLFCRRFSRARRADEETRYLQRIESQMKENADTSSNAQPPLTFPQTLGRARKGLF